MRSRGKDRPVPGIGSFGAVASRRIEPGTLGKGNASAAGGPAAEAHPNRHRQGDACPRPEPDPTRTYQSLPVQGNPGEFPQHPMAPGCERMLPTGRVSRRGTAHAHGFQRIAMAHRSGVKALDTLRRVAVFPNCSATMRRHKCCSDATGRGCRRPLRGFGRALPVMVRCEVARGLYIATAAAGSGPHARWCPCGRDDKRIRAGPGHLRGPEWKLR